MIESVRPWTWTSSTWAGLQFVVLVVAAVVAWRQVREARRLREEQARPFVVIDMEVWQTIAEFKITNIGSTMARDVQLVFDPPLASSWDDEPGRTPLLQTNLLKHGIPSLPPGKEVTVLFDQLPSRIEKGLPDDYDVRVSYTDTTGKRHTESMVVGFGFLRETGRIHRHGIHDVHTRLEELVREVKKWAAFGGGIKTMSPSDIKQYHEELDEIHATHEQAITTETTDPGA